MIGTLVFAAACILAIPEGVNPADGDVLKEYEAVSRSVGHSADANLKLALWCEEHRLMPERERHLAMVIVADPNNATARGLLGQVFEEGKWRSAGEVAAIHQDDPQRVAILALYKARRDKSPETADAQWKLGLWCEKNGLNDQATAHFVSVIRAEPNHELARKRLRYRRQGMRWVTNEQSAREKHDADLQEQADRHWKPKLEKLRTQLKQRDNREEAERRLAEIQDPGALNSVLHVFGHGDQMPLVRLLGQIDSPEASMPLAMLAVNGQTPEIRRVATEIVRNRDPREFVGWLISTVREPLQLSIKENESPDSLGEIAIEGPRAKLRRNYRPAIAPFVPLLPGDFLYYDEYGLPAIARYVGSQTTFSERQQRLAIPVASPQAADSRSEQIREAVDRITPGFNPLGPMMDSAAAPGGGSFVTATTRRSYRWDFYEQIPVGRMIRSTQLANERLRWQLAADAAQIRRSNDSVEQFNDRVLPVLEIATGEKLGADRHAWLNWWADFWGYAQSQAPEKPQVFDEVQANPEAVFPTMAVSLGASLWTNSILNSPSRFSCFGRGTLVRTLAGPIAIETLKIGDVVLASDTTTGALSYQPIVAVHHNPPAAALKIDLGSDIVVATGIHRLWKAGKGWVMARDLRAGDVLRTVSGTVEVKSVTAEKVQPVFNLEVAEGHDFFVGKSGVLAHDHSVIKPVSDPFDARPELAAVSEQ
jgi:hypothetical protein